MTTLLILYIVFLTLYIYKEFIYDDMSYTIVVRNQSPGMQCNPSVSMKTPSANMYNDNIDDQPPDPFINNGMIEHIPRASPASYNLTEKEQPHLLSANDIGSLADNKLYDKLKIRGSMDKTAMDNFSKSNTSTSKRKYFEDELNAGEKSIWWEQDIKK